MCLHIVYSWGFLEALGLQNTRSKMDRLVIKKALVGEESSLITLHRQNSCQQMPIS